MWRAWWRAWYRLHGERKLLTTFWPGDYRRDDAFELERCRYRVTRYIRASEPDTRFYEVWGRLSEAGEPAANGQAAKQAGTTL